MKNVLKIVNSKNREFNVKIVRQGDAYGRDNCLIHDEAEPLVEYYDATYSAENGDDRFDPEGQFVARYYAKTLLGGVSRHYGIDLMGYEPAWKIDGAAQAVAIRWIENQLRADAQAEAEQFAIDHADDYRGADYAND